MNLLSRYIFRSVFLASIAAVGLFVFVLLVGNAVKDIMGLLAGGAINIPLFFDLLLLLIPYVFSYAMPIGMLSGVLLVLGRLSSSREIVAMKAAGISIWHISAPIFAVALLGVLTSTIINTYYAPAAKVQLRTIPGNVIRDDPLRIIVPKTFIHAFPGYVLYVDDKDGTDLKDFWIWELDDQRRAIRLLRAESGRFDYNPENNSLVLYLQNGFTELRSESDPDDLSAIRPTISFEVAPIALPLDQILGNRRVYRSLSALTLPQLMERERMLTEQLSAATSEAEREEIASERSKVRFQTQENFAMAFSILSLCMLGIPLGIRVSRGESYANVGLALGLALLYYLLNVFVSWTDDNPALRPDMLIWLPNILFQATGIILMIRSNKH